jgi:hypothetical protein
MSDCTASRPVRPTVDALTLALDPLPKASAMVFDTGLRYVIVRGPALARQGFSAASVAGLLVADAPSAQRWAFYERRDRAAFGGETGSVEVPSPDGKLWDLVEVGPLRAGDGEAIGGVSFAADVTERTQAEAGTAPARRDRRVNGRCGDRIDVVGGAGRRCATATWWRATSGGARCPRGSCSDRAGYNPHRARALPRLPRWESRWGGR